MSTKPDVNLNIKNKRRRSSKAEREKRRQEVIDLIKRNSDRWRERKGDILPFIEFEDYSGGLYSSRTAQNEVSAGNWPGPVYKIGRKSVTTVDAAQEYLISKVEG